MRKPPSADAGGVSPTPARPRANKWWNEDLANRRKETRRLHHKASKTKDDESIWAEYRRSRNDFLKAIRKAKREAWKTFTGDANNPEAMSNLMKVIFNQRNKKLGHLRREDGTLTCSREEVLDTLLDSFFPDSTPVREVTVPKKVLSRVQN